MPDHDARLAFIRHLRDEYPAPGIRADLLAQITAGLTLVQIEGIFRSVRQGGGQITFDVEGNDDPDSRFFSRRTHWPAGASGVTIGRGYDMRHRSRAEVKADLLAAGVPPITADKLSRGAGLSGRRAQRFAQTYRNITITREAQKALFEQIYGDYEDMTQGLVCGWTGRSGAACDSFWSGLDPAIATLLTDLRYRGDLTRSRFNRYLKSSVNSNSVSSLSKVMSNRRYWSSVPADRFRRRKAFMQAAAGNT